MLFLVFIHYFWALIIGFHIIYVFQIKEYRFDRLKSMIKEIGIFRFLYTIKIRIPALTLRNILLILFHLMVTSVLFLFSFEQKSIFGNLGRTFFLAPFTAYLMIAIGVLITSIPSSIIRSWIRYQAMTKVKKSKTMFIGITGSFGKTSTKEYLAYILSGQFDVAKTPKNMNTDVGIALSINRSLKPETEFFITELGAYRKGELNHAASYIPFKFIILTGLGNQHIDLYGSKEALIAEETSPLYNLPSDGKAYLNNKANIIVQDIQSATYGVDNGVDVRLEHIGVSSNETTGVITYKNHVLHIQTKLLGAHSLENLLPAIALALDVGMESEVIEKRIATIKPLKGKLSVHTGYNDAIILHDGVNTNFNGFLAAIDVMKLFTSENKIIMTQGIIELGREKRSTYLKILQKMNDAGISLYTTDKLFNTIKSSTPINTFNDVESMQKTLLQQLNKNTLLLIEGTFAQPILDSIVLSK